MAEKKGELTVVQEKFLSSYDPDKSVKLESISTKLRKSGMFPHITNDAQAFSIVEYGYELGIPPMAALQSMAIVKGKLCVEGKLMLAQYIRAGGKYVVRKRTTTDSEIHWEYQGNAGTTTFTKADAQRIGLLTKDNWRNYPEEMMFWRNVAKGIRAYAPDVLLFAQTIEEATVGEAAHVVDLTRTQPLKQDAKITEKMEIQDAEIIEKSEQPAETAETEAKLVQRIHIIKNEKQVSDHDYRELIGKIAEGKTSSKELAFDEKETLLHTLETFEHTDEPPPDKTIEETPEAPHWDFTKCTICGTTITTGEGKWCENNKKPISCRNCRAKMGKREGK